jgi:hypothetical protein
MMCGVQWCHGCRRGAWRCRSYLADARLGAVSSRRYRTTTAAAMAQWLTIPVCTPDSGKTVPAFPLLLDTDTACAATHGMKGERLLSNRAVGTP